MLALFVVFLLVGCYGPIFIPYTTPEAEYTFFQAQVDPNQESARVIQKEGFETYGSRIDIVELTNSQFKMLVYYDHPFLEMSLIVPAGEELFMKESLVELFDTTTQQELYKFDVKWFHVDSQLDDDTGRLIGLMSSPPATKYKAWKLIFHGDLAKTNGIVLKLPVFRTKGNESIKFNDVTFNIFTRTEYKSHVLGHY